jgi:hypothetical protein
MKFNPAAERSLAPGDHLVRSARPSASRLAAAVERTA